MKNISNDAKAIDLFCGAGLLKLCFKSAGKDYEKNDVSDKHTAVLLGKEKEPEKNRDEETRVTQTFIIKIPPKFQFLGKLKKVTKSIIFQQMRNIIHKVVEGVLIKLLVELILSLIHEKEAVYC